MIFGIIMLSMSIASFIYQIVAGKTDQYFADLFIFLFAVLGASLIRGEKMQIQSIPPAT